MKYCSQCGSSSADGDAFCGSCGAPATQTIAPTAAPAVANYASAMVAPSRAGERFIGQWNWGAAFWYPYWLMTHRRVSLGIVWLVVGLIPFVNFATFGAFFYFGLYGNRIAVLSGRYNSEEEFVTVQNIWRNWAFGLIVLLVALFFIAAFIGAVDHHR